MELTAVVFEGNSVLGTTTAAGGAVSVVGVLGAAPYGLSITNCNLAGVSGAFGLKGAQLDASDLPSLAVSLAREAGIRIRDD